MSHSLSSPHISSPEHEREPTSLVEVLRRRALRQPERLAYTFLLDGESDELTLSYAELDARARAIAASLQSRGAAGERVLLLFPAGLDYVAAFFGCLYAGAVAVPLYPPRPNVTLKKLQSVTADSRATIGLTVSSVMSRIEPLLEQSTELKSLRWVVTDRLDEDSAASWLQPSVGLDTLAFLQYTSGSTSQPKGVMVSHGNLLHNERMIQRAFEQTEHSIVVGWLPLYHDMGLIGTVLQPLYVGAHCVLMSPVSFLQSPFRWLQTVSRYKATTSGGPNFAYDLCARKVTPEQRATLDLSSWSVAFNGAEPIREETLERFVETFGACGFRREAFYPCYGLAEATLFVSGGEKGAGASVKSFSREALTRNSAVETPGAGKETGKLVSCGRARLGQHVRIVDPDSSSECAPGRVGEIWVAGPSVAKGYWDRPEATEHTFMARLADTGEGPFLRTGDLGFMHGGELFVTGRLKDLVIIRGVNHYPQDIEQSVERSHTALRPGCGATFSVEVDGEERLAVVQEVERGAGAQFDEIIERIRRRVAEEHEVQVAAVTLIKPHTILKTSSGKIRRSACREAFLQGRLTPVAVWTESAQPGHSGHDGGTLPATHAPDEDSLEAWLVGHLSAKLRLDAREVDVRQSITHYGADSLTAVELIHSVETALGVSLPLAEVLQSPSIAELAEQLRAALRDAATNRLQETTTGKPRASVEATMLDAAGAHALSAGQQALWFINQLAPDSPAYNIANAIRVNGSLDTSALRRALQTLVERHSMLRTTFKVVGGKPSFDEHASASVCFETEDARALGEAAFKERLAEESRVSFDLGRGPLLRVKVFERGEREHVIALVVHHIVADFWSLSVLADELARLYEAEAEGTSVSLPPHESRYADYVRWQSERLSGAAGEALRAYWERQLSGRLPLLDLPTDHPRPPVQTFRGASYSFRLDAETSRRVKTLGQSRGATLYMTLLAAFHALLHRYTGQTDLLVGAPTSGRARADFAPLVGYFVNPVVMRANLEGNPTFEEFLGRVRRTALEAFEHQDYPFPLLVERLHPERDLSRSPVFQVMFVLQQAPPFGRTNLSAFALGEAGAVARLGLLPVESVALEQRVSQFDLLLMMAETEDGLAASLQYSTDLFERDTVERLGAHLVTLLEGIAANPGQRISDLPLLTAEERRRLLSSRDETRAEGFGEILLHEQFERQAGRTPDATAVVDEQTRLTYSELNERANQLAHRLRRMGVVPESLVGIMTERSASIIIALLGILKAGGAYVPLDPAYPKDRLQFIMEDAAARLLLTERKLRELLPPTSAHVIELDAEADSLARESTENPRVPVVPSNLAYVIYTSGSTGRPKGVAIEHHSASTLLDWSRTVFTPEQLAGTLVATSICFDLSVFEIFVPLSCGGRLVVAENALQLPRLKAAGEVTLVNTVPSAMTELVRSGAIPASVRTVNLAGEPLTNQLVQSLYEQQHIQAVYNLYGPSEDTTYSTCALASKGATTEPTIGRPVANTEAYVLDTYLQPVATRVAGELFVGGDGVARGYLNRPGLTAERFVPHPFSAEAGARLYRTGDLVRRRPDGELEYLGRRDQQVKLRGFRIELGEIEAVLRAHPSIKDVLVMVREADGDKRIAAYVVAVGEGAPGAAGWREYLKERLPYYMVPSAFVELERLPLLPNGKVDRHALPAPRAEAEAGEGTVGGAARTPVEEILLGICADLLRIRHLSLTDNFFETGGHSLLATQLLSRIKESFSVDLPLRNVFEYPTMGQLAAVVESRIGSGVSESQPPLVPARRDGLLPLSYAQQRLWLTQQLEPSSAAYNVAAAVRLEGALSRHALEQMLNEIVRRHEVTRTRFASRDGSAIQIIAERLQLRLSQADLSALDEEARGRAAYELMLAEAGRPFDLERDVLLRMKLLRLGEREHVVLLTMHHIISDGWSINILMEEMSSLYEAFAGGRPSPLDELPVQYMDYAVWQRQLLEGELLESHLAYWKKQLHESPTLLKLPSDHPRPAVRSGRGRQESFALPAGLSAALEALCAREGATLFMTLLAVFETLLYRYGGQTDIVLGTNIANRRSTQTEKLVGFFVNMLVLRTDLSGNPTFRELLGRVREVTLDAYTHQDLPFEKLVQELRPERSLSHAMLFQAVFSLQNAGRETLRFSGLTLNLLEIDLGTAKYDLVLNMWEGGDGLRGVLQYSTDMFEPPTITRMLSHFTRLLESVVAAPETRINALDMLPPEENSLLTREIHIAELDAGFAL
jgi:amino acid adenylation domain-containing protein